jgi:hypothetical protein
MIILYKVFKILYHTCLQGKLEALVIAALTPRKWLKTTFDLCFVIRTIMLAGTQVVPVALYY